MFICLYVYMFIYLYVYMFIHLYVYMFIHLYVYMFQLEPAASEFHAPQKEMGQRLMSLGGSAPGEGGEGGVEEEEE